MMERNGKRGWCIGLMLAIALMGVPGTAAAQPKGCAADFNGDGFATTADWPLFLALWTAGNTRADLNADNVVDFYDALTFRGYFLMTLCPWNADYQYNRSIDPVDAAFFSSLYVAGNLRADMNGDGFVTPLDYSTFLTVYNLTY